MNLHWDDVTGGLGTLDTTQPTPIYSSPAFLSLQPTRGAWLHSRDDYEHPYVLKFHRASKDHLDLRLCIREIALSWAMYSMPSFCPDRGCTVIEVEDHLRKNILFEGVHAQGRRGAGPTIVVDQGSWQPMAECFDLGESLRRGRLRFRIKGNLLPGIWLLTRQKDCFRPQNPRWMLTKEPDIDSVREDSFKNRDWMKLRSCRTGLTIEETERNWNLGRRRLRACGSFFGLETP